jgi:hypothetical protein
VVSLQIVDFLEAKTTTSMSSGTHQYIKLPLITFCFNPFYKKTNTDAADTFDTKSWMYSYITGFYNTFESENSKELWSQSVYKVKTF